MFLAALKTSTTSTKRWPNRWPVWAPMFCSASSADSSRAYSTGQNSVHSSQSAALTFFLENVGFTGIPLCVAFILLCSFVNIFVSSGSAKWAIFAPIFVPMFMLLGYHPGFTQLCYRIGDSPFNCWTPMSAYIWMILSVAQTKYVPNLKIGTLIANMIPMSIVLQIAWIIFLVIWMLLGIPFGPGVGIYLPAGVM